MADRDVSNRRFFKSAFETPFSFVESLVHETFTYSTERSAAIKSLRVGIIYRICQVIILAYVIGWELIHNKGYQTFDHISSVVTTKVKGQGYVPNNLKLDKDFMTSNHDLKYYEDLYTLHKNVSYAMMDTADYVIPPNEFNSVFIKTNFIKTNQIRNSCDEEISKFKAVCKTDDDCKSLGSFTNSWNGIPTGRCVNSSTVSNLKVCEIRSWCPTEHENHRRNILPKFDNKYISTCIYDEIEDPYCPIFRVKEILDKAEPDPKEIYQMLIKGGVILIEIIWNCDFDFKNYCLPEYSFRRFDAKDTNTASGFNFRFATKFLKSDVEYRVLYKVYGLRFIINVSGIAGKFNIIPLMLTIGAGIGLMSFSVIIADCVLLNCTKKKKFYLEIKELDASKVEVKPPNVVRI